MKNYTLSFVFVFLASISCNRNDTTLVDGRETALSTEISVSFSKSNAYKIYEPFKYNIRKGDNVIVYRLENTLNGRDVWQLLPRTFYVYRPEGDRYVEIDFDFSFDVKGVNFYVGGTFNKDNPQSYVVTYLKNQVFRAVIVPGNIGARPGVIDYKDYSAVMKFYHLKESDFKTLK
ncbi:hypothetical protein GNY06_10650 [Elizabethkingia argentiflava]|uniref:Lipoprotein n=1 Tax=Elizabethkingia argenteiflava TaxID=2681556 RepID=A0A845PUB4_9FLAO|nr:hypothetical protein [Elizabethkingia argenteiflava]NAW51809.1 hypothetical protein [Elizabethkingia argenteiflava]